MSLKISQFPRDWIYGSHNEFYGYVRVHSATQMSVMLEHNVLEVVALDSIRVSVSLNNTNDTFEMLVSYPRIR
jgi:hypothetical protein